MAHLHIQYGHQNVQIIFRIVSFPRSGLQSTVFMVWVSNCHMYHVLRSLTNIWFWIIHIFNIITKRAKLCSEQHIFLSAIDTFYCMGLNFSIYFYLRSHWTKFKFGWSAYSKKVQIIFQIAVFSLQCTFLWCGSQVIICIYALVPLKKL